jgi:hypothetical protein
MDSIRAYETSSRLFSTRMSGIEWSCSQYSKRLAFYRAHAPLEQVKCLWRRRKQLCLNLKSFVVEGPQNFSRTTTGLILLEDGSAD